MSAQYPQVPEPSQPALPVVPESGAPRKRTAVIAVGTVLTLCVVGGGAFAAVQLLKGGPQAEQALPASVLGVVTVDLDPSAGQKIEAIKTLRKFPSFREDAKIDSGDDLRERFFTEVIDTGQCKSLSYERDVEPWVGDNAGVAAMDVSGQPVPLLALAVTDEDAAATGLKKIATCSGSEDTGIAFVNGFALVSDNQRNADRAAKEAADQPLADDATYQKWADRTGDRGVVNFYVAKKAGAFLRDQAGALTGTTTTAAATSRPSAADPFKNFEGGAGALRFADGGLELEIVGNAQDGAGSKVAGELAGRLPADTAAVLGISVPDGYVDNLTQALEGLGLPLADQLGLDLPGDLEALLGKGLAVSIGGTPPEDLAGIESPGDLPAGLTISGDEAKVKAVVDKLLAGTGQDASDLVVESADGRVTLSFDQDYAAALSKGGQLADDDRFDTVVPEADKASFVLYADLDSPWRKAIAKTLSVSEKRQVLDNTEPLSAVGASAWQDGDTTRFLLKVTTD